jgi:hypothetical protein
MPEPSDLTVRIARVLSEHRGTATEFCGGCGHVFMPETWEIDDWDTVGIIRHQAEQVRAVLGETSTEWGVKHSQGIRKATSEADARSWSRERNVVNEHRHDFERRHKTTVVTRTVTPWVEVAP